MITKYRSTRAFAAIGAGLVTAFGVYAAEEEEDIRELIRPQSTVEAGVGYVNKDNLRFGQYTGLNEEGVYGLLGADVMRRDDSTGTWLRLTGRNLGLDSRDLRFEHERQGNWRYFIDFSQTPRLTPYIVNSAIAGLGTPTQALAGLPAPVDTRLETRRDALSAGFGKHFGGGFDVQVRYRHEEKEGARLYGQGTNGIVNFLAEPINQTTHQFDAVASFTRERLQLSGGYYGTGFDNHNTRLDVVGGIAGQSPMSLPPDNESHQVHLSGGYSITPTTRATFKAAYGRITQHDAFIGPSINGRTDLGGRIDVRQLQIGLTARPVPRLSLLANLRQEDRDDRTPVAQYFSTGVGATSTLEGINEPRSIKTSVGKLEAAYALPANFRVAAGIDYDERERNTYRVRSVSHRDKTEETTYRAELRRSISSIAGAVSYAHSERDGTPFLATILNGGGVGSNLVAPIHLADRVRDKLGLQLQWAATDAFSVQFMGHVARDDYEQRTAEQLGPRRGEALFTSLDAAYTFSEAWQASAWVSADDNRMDQATRTGTTNWAANLRNTGVSAGLGLTGKASARVDVGADLSLSRIRDKFGVQTIVGTAPPEAIPDITTKLVTLKLSTRYALQKNSGLRLQYIYDRWQSDEWTWSDWVYSDGTRVVNEPKQEVHFLGLSYYYRFL